MNKYNLRNLQNDFKTYLFTGEISAKLSAVVSPPQEKCLKIYYTAYYTRLQETLAHYFPVLLKAMGDELFGKSMAMYLQQNPSTSPSLRNIGDNLIKWLEKNSSPDYFSIAQIEFAILTLLDTYDEPIITPEDLHKLHIDEWPNLKLTLQKNITILTIKNSIAILWNTYSKLKINSFSQNSESITVVISRLKYSTLIMQVSSELHCFLKLIKAKKNFAEICSELDTLKAQKNTANLSASFLSIALEKEWITYIEK